MDKRILTILKKPSLLFLTLGRRGFFNWMADERYLKIAYYIKVGQKLNLEDPQTFNEKLQWLKLYGRKPEYTMMVDKYAVKRYVAEKIGEEHIIPTLAVWNNVEDIDFGLLPNQFVLKCNHDSGSIVICKDKDKMDKKAIIAKYRKYLRRNGYWYGREWPYKEVKPCIIAEPYMVDESGGGLKDYKIFNFDGEPKLIEVDFDRFVSHKRNLYSPAWNIINAEIEYPSDKTRKIECPKQISEMLGLARILSDGIPHVRTDFYVIGDKVYFGELTFYHGSGFEKFLPAEFGKKLGDWISVADDAKGK